MTKVKKSICDQCKKECDGRYMLIQYVYDIGSDKPKEKEEIGLCWPCYRTYKKDERHEETNFDILFEKLGLERISIES